MSINQTLQIFSNTSAGSTANQAIQVDNTHNNAIEVITRVSSLSTGPGNITVTLESLVPGTTVYNTIVASTAYTSTGIFTLRCASGLTSASNAQVNQPAPKDMRVSITNGSTEPPNAYKVGAYLTGNH